MFLKSCCRECMGNKNKNQNLRAGEIIKIKKKSRKSIVIVLSF